MSIPRPGGTRFALRRNSRVAYDPGIAPHADAPVVVFLHALLADRGSFAAQQKALGDRYRVVVPDARGHGASATLANQWYTVAEFAADVLTILDAEEIPTAHVVGHELGGVIAVELARRHPERVRSITLIEPALSAILDNDPDPETRRVREETRAADRAAADAAYKGLTDKALDGYLAPRWGAGWRDEVPRPRLGAIRRNAGALAGLLPALDGYAVTHGDLRRLTTPALILVGDDATPLARLTAERIASVWPQVQHASIALASRPSAPLGGEAARDLNRRLCAFLD